MFDSRIAVFDPRPYSQCPRYLTSTITHIYITAYFPDINRNCKIQKKMYDRFYTLVSKSNRTKLGKFYFESNGPSLIRPNQVFELQGVSWTLTVGSRVKYSYPRIEHRADTELQCTYSQIVTLKLYNYIYMAYCSKVKILNAWPYASRLQSTDCQTI
jgi:hypothetical protein